MKRAGNNSKFIKFLSATLSSYSRSTVPHPVPHPLQLLFEHFINAIYFVKRALQILQMSLTGGKSE